MICSSEAQRPEITFTELCLCCPWAVLLLEVLAEPIFLAFPVYRSSFIHFYIFLFWLHHETICRILVPWPETEPVPPALGKGEFQRIARGHKDFLNGIQWGIWNEANMSKFNSYFSYPPHTCSESVLKWQLYNISTQKACNYPWLLPFT